MSDVVKVEKCGSLATITIDRPQALNALDEEVLLALREAVLGCHDRRVVIFRGGGEKAFVAGADISGMAKMTPLEARTFAELGQGVMRLIEEASFVSIAAVNGFALGGGCELALACDLIYASEKAQLGLPETNLGIIPGFGGTLNLIERVGYGRALEMVLRGHRISAADAKAYGLVLEVFPADQFFAEVEKIAKAIADKGPLSILAARRTVKASRAIQRENNWMLERETFATLFSSCEPHEGMTAFLEKRAPRFNG